jgi:FkbM family methyltransferase
MFVHAAQRWLGPARSGSLRSALIRMSRTYLRAPVTGKRLLWKALVGPHLAWASHDFVAETSFGARMAGNTQDIIQRYIYYFGLWEPPLTQFLSRRLQPGDVFVDVGANIGYFSLLAAKLVGDEGGVVAIEPSPTVHAALEDNLRLNGVCNVRAVRSGASDRRRTLALYLGPEDNLGGTTTSQGVTEGARFECEIEVLPLVDLLAKDELERARVIKIDVEGMEWEVMGGLWAGLDRTRADIEVVIEVDPARLAREGHSAEALFARFGDAGFFPYVNENDYSAAAYLPPRSEKRPRRIDSLPDQQVDVVFSREDATSL